MPTPGTDEGLRAALLGGSCRAARAPFDESTAPPPIVRFHSREGALALGREDLAPRLVITIDDV